MIRVTCVRIDNRGSCVTCVIHDKSVLCVACGICGIKTELNPFIAKKFLGGALTLQKSLICHDV